MGNKLGEGISILYDMEKNNYMMTRAIASLDERIHSLGYKRKIYAPTKKKTEGFFGILETVWSSGGVGILVGSIIGFIVGVITLFGEDTDIFGKIIFGPFIVGIFGVVGAVIGGVVVGIGGLIFSVQKEVKDKQNSEAQYSRNYEDYQRKLRIDKARVEAELREKKILINERDSLILRLQEAKCNLVKFYNIVGIDEKFRNLLPMAYMNELVRLGISNKLDGVDGLYYLTRQELKDYQMMCTLENISEKLDTIIENQRDIKNELRQVNITCDNMLSQAVRNAEELARGNAIREQIANNTAITAYNSQRILQEERYQSFLLTFGRKEV